MPREAGRVPTLPAGSAPATGPTRDAGALARPPSPGWQGAFLFLAVAAVLFLVAGLSLAHLPFIGSHVRADLFPGRPWIEAWLRWDSGWYGAIADRGYWLYDPTRQSPVAFFPAYPIVMRAGRAVVGHSLLAGVLVTLAAGTACAALFASWLRSRVSPAAAWTALLLFVLFPFSFYLYGAVYADALFIAAVLAAFLLLERDQPWLAGLCGAVATAARPVGVVVVVALVVRAAERRGGLRRVRWRDAGVLVAAAGIGAYCLYTWVRFGTPLAFLEAQKGWDQTPGPVTWLKLEFFDDLTEFSRSILNLIDYLAHPIVTVVALALVPRVVRRFGWGYGTYALLVVGVSALSTKNFFGMGRYVLAAFPCFAVAGELLAERPRLRTAALAGSGLALAVATSYFARGYYLS